MTAGRLKNYGTETAQRYLKKWSTQFPEPSKKPSREPEESSENGKRKLPTDR
jgi:hypothetical protein